MAVELQVRTTSAVVDSVDVTLSALVRCRYVLCSCIGNGNEIFFILYIYSLCLFYVLRGGT